MELVLKRSHAWEKALGHYVGTALPTGTATQCSHMGYIPKVSGSGLSCCSGFHVNLSYPFKQTGKCFFTLQLIKISEITDH